MSIGSKIVPSELFLSCQRDFQSNYSSLLKNVVLLFQSPSQTLFKETYSLLTNCQKALKQMELELSNLLGESKGDYSNQIKDFKRNLENQKNKIEQLEDDFSRKSLYGEKESQNQGLLDKGEKISVQNKNLVEARNNMISCEIDAIDAQRELHRQTGVMEKGINRMKEVWGELSISNKFVSLISQRRLRQKAVLYVVMLLVALAFLFIIYWNLIR